MISLFRKYKVKFILLFRFQSIKGLFLPDKVDKLEYPIEGEKHKRSDTKNILALFLLFSFKL